MRFAFTAALMVIISTATAFASSINVESLSVQRALNGKWQACSVESHAGRTSWILENAKVEGVGAVQIRVSGEMNFVRCVINPKSNGTTDAPVMWVRANPQDKVSTVSPTKKIVYSWYENLEGLVINDLNRILSSDSSNGGNSISFSHVLETDQFLSEVEQLELADGKPVFGRLGVLPRGVYFAHLDGEEPASMGLRTLGRYSLVFKMKRK